MHQVGFHYTNALLSRSVSHSARKCQIAKGRCFRPCVGVQASCPLDRD